MTVAKKKAAKKVVKTPAPPTELSVEEQATTLLLMSFRGWLRYKASHLLDCEVHLVPDPPNPTALPYLRLRNVPMDAKLCDGLHGHAIAELLYTTTGRNLENMPFDVTASRVFDSIFDYIFPALQGCSPALADNDTITYLDLS